MFSYCNRLWILVLLIVLAIILIPYIKSEVNIYRLEKLTTIPTFTEQDIAYNHIYIDEDTLPAVSGVVFDREGDGTPEVFITGGAGQQDLVLAYVDGNIVDVAEDTGLSSLGATYRAHVFDVDNDGDDDLLIAREDDFSLYVNTDGFYEKSLIPLDLEDKAVAGAVSTADLDGDGFDDLYVSTFIRSPFLKPATFNDPDHLTANIVLHNNGDYTFSDITASSGLAYSQNTFSSKFLHLDDDDLIDLIVIPNTDRVRVYKNLGDATFKEMNPITDYGFWMGYAVDDFILPPHLLRYCASRVPTMSKLYHKRCGGLPFRPLLKKSG